jgi:membrane fusion protein
VHDLFRKEALAAKGNQFLGRTVLRPPLSFAAWSWIAAGLAAAVVTFLLVGEYTKRTRVVGITAPEAGLIKLMAPQPGIVIERRVQEGQQVKAGDTLFILSAERLTEAGGGVAGAQTAILEQLQRRRASLQGELQRQALVTETQMAAAARRLADLQAESAQLGRELVTQTSREASMQAQLRRFEELAGQNFMSPLALQQKRDELLEQTARTQALERSRLALQREAATVSAELRQIPLRGEQQLAELQRSLAALQQEVAGTEANRQIVVTAPKDGTVTAIIAERGQMAGTQPLATLLPRDSALQAHLYAPSRAVGFIEPGQTVRIRYAAYPYQKFGQYEGKVEQVARSALASGELPPQLAAIAQQAQGEGMYRITVALRAPTVMAYGKAQPLTAGMQLEADVMQDTRRLIEWVFEPLVSLRGKV